MMKILSEKRVVKNHQKLIAKMVQSFIKQAAYKEPDEVLKIYNSFNENWKFRVRKVNERYGKFILSFDVWEREWKDNGYIKFTNIPIPNDLPDDEKKELLKMKTELIRLVFIIEGKTEKQRERRETFYKLIFLKNKIFNWFKKLFSKKEIEKEKEVAEASAFMQVL